MKKTSKLFGAVALTAALTLGTAIPAFAAGTGSVESGGHHAYDGQAATGDTVVKMRTENTQIDVAVPLGLSFYAKSSGGDLTAPSADAYNIDNYSSAPVYITNAQVAYATDNANGKNWKLSEDAKANSTTGLPPEASATPAYGDVLITAAYKQIRSATTDPSSATLKTAKITTEGQLEGMGTDGPIYIAKSDDGTTPSKFNIEFGGYSSILKKTDDKASDVIKITYTVSTSSTITTADTGEGKGVLDQTA